MNDLIDRQSAIKAIYALSKKPVPMLEATVDEVEALPTVEAIPVSYVEKIIEHAKETGCSTYAVALEKLINDWGKEKGNATD